MTLSCLTCQALRRTDSDKEFALSPYHSSGSGSRSGSGSGDSGPETNHILRRVFRRDVGRSWSGNLSPRMCAKIGRSGSSVAPQRMKKVKKGRHLRTDSPMGSAEPRLVRSSGMRRDWSFEDLTQR